MKRSSLATVAALCLLAVPAPCWSDGAPEPQITGRLEIDTVRTFVVEAREVFADSEQQQRNVDYVNKYVEPGSPAASYMAAWYREHDPFALGKTEQVTPTPGDVYLKSGDTDVVLWKETIRDAHGNLIETQKWKATVRFEWVMKVGLYQITSIKWVRLR